MNTENITMQDLIQSLKQLPKTLIILKKVDCKLFFLSVLLSLATGIFPVITLLISQELINSISLQDKELMDTFILLSVYVILSIIVNFFNEADEYTKSLYQYKIQYNLQYLIMNKCTKLKLKDFESSETYDKIEKVTTEVAYRPFQMFLSVVSTITALVTMFSSMLIILAWKPYMALILLVIPTLSVIYYLKIGQQEFDMLWNRAKEERKMWYYNHLLTHDFSYKEIQVLGIGKYLLLKYAEISKKFIDGNRKILNKKTIFDSIYEIFVQLTSFGIIGVAIISSFLGNLLIGNVISIINAVGMIQSNSKTIMSGVYSIYSNSLYMEMVFDFLDKKESEQDGIKLNKIEFLSDIELKDVSFSYDNNNNVLKNVSLKLEKGKSVAIVGSNGSGKSTLLKLIIGLYKPSSGDIFFNGISNTQIDMKDLYKKMSILFQDFVKYELTLRENIGFGCLTDIENNKKIKSVLKKINTSFFEDEQGEYNLEQQLGNWFENGRELSQGQWQKVALSRVCLKDAMCYILDEPNAALDTVSEKEVFDTFSKEAKNKIYVYISHRLSSAKMADEIIVMDKGEIVAQGKHEDLLKNSPAYQRLYEAENYEMGYTEYGNICG